MDKIKIFAADSLGHALMLTLTEEDWYNERELAVLLTERINADCHVNMEWHAITTSVRGHWTVTSNDYLILAVIYG